MKWLFGFIWAIVLYICMCMVAGAIVGAMAGSKEKDPEHAAAAGARASAEFVGENRLSFAIGSVTLALVGTALGCLPGTGKKAPAVAVGSDWSDEEEEDPQPTRTYRPEPARTVRPPAHVPADRPIRPCSHCRTTDTANATSFRVRSGPAAGKIVTLCAACASSLAQPAGNRSAHDGIPTAEVWEPND